MLTNKELIGEVLKGGENAMNSDVTEVLETLDVLSAIRRLQPDYSVAGKSQEDLYRDLITAANPAAKDELDGKDAAYLKGRALEVADVIRRLGARGDAAIAPSSPQIAQLRQRRLEILKAARERREGAK